MKNVTPLTRVTLPQAPRNASPLPWLTSIHSSIGRGPWGSSRYRGNCDGYLIKDLLQYFGARSVLDPMTGSGTCRDVCRDLGIPCVSFDIKSGRDASDASSYRGLEPADFAWLHPPYWRMIRYSENPSCMSNAPSLDAFLGQLTHVLTHCRNALTQDGHIAVLIGSYQDRQSGNRQIPLPALTTQAAIAAGLWPACTDIIRFQHGNTSSRRTYRSSFIPGLHDVCTVYSEFHQHKKYWPHTKESARVIPLPISSKPQMP
ncbi:MAG: hypothetical protein H6832_09365 [Planctomycetes bacterium]|nr:hypothetical protein [Planctomycetota bacterium]